MQWDQEPSVNLPSGIQMSPVLLPEVKGLPANKQGRVKGVPAAGGEAGPSSGTRTEVTHQQDLD